MSAREKRDAFVVHDEVHRFGSASHVAELDGETDDVPWRLGLELPNSLGFFYSFITAHLGFEAFSDEYKVMGLAAYGRPTYVDKLREVIVRQDGGRYRVSMERLKNLEPLLGPARAAGAPLIDRHRDIARSTQVLLEETLEHVIAAHLARTGMRRLCTAGGVFLNCVANARLPSSLWRNSRWL
jgi:carbamoyltransferase